MEVLTQLTPAQFLGFLWLNNLLRYLLIAGLTYYIFWKWGFKKFQVRFLYRDKPLPEDIKREFIFSIISTLIFLLPTIFAIIIREWGWNKVYFDISERSMAWYVLSFVFVFFIHDTYFYWTHRLMHHRYFYKAFHRIHHLSRKPTPLAAFSFHPLEAIVESLVFVLISFLVPVHFSVLMVFTLFSLFMNVYGHLGFNLFSEKKLQKSPLKHMGHPSTHGWHHQYFNGNYGFYLLFWDKMMGTYKGGLKS